MDILILGFFDTVFRFYICWLSRRPTKSTYIIFLWFISVVYTYYIDKNQTKLSQQEFRKFRKVAKSLSKEKTCDLRKFSIQMGENSSLTI